MHLTKNHLMKLRSGMVVYRCHVSVDDGVAQVMLDARRLRGRRYLHKFKSGDGSWRIGDEFLEDAIGHSPCVTAFTTYREALRFTHAVKTNVALHPAAKAAVDDAHRTQHVNKQLSFVVKSPVIPYGSLLGGLGGLRLRRDADHVIKISRSSHG